MDEESKIELGDFITDELCKYLNDGSKFTFDIFGADYLEIDDSVLKKVEELSE